MPIIMMQEVKNPRLAANLWATKAVKVTFQTMGVKLMGHEEDFPVVPAVPSKFITAAWYDFCKTLEIHDTRGVFFSDGRDEGIVGGLIFDVRNRNRVNRITGVADRFFSELMVAGIFTATIRFDPKSAQNVDLFLNALDHGFCRLGRSRSVYGFVKVLSRDEISAAKAKEFESVQITVPKMSFNGEISELNKVYSFTQIPDFRRQLLNFWTGGNTPLQLAMNCLYQSVHPKSVWSLKPTGASKRLGEAMHGVLKELPDIIAVRLFLKEIMA